MKPDPLSIFPTPLEELGKLLLKTERNPFRGTLIAVDPGETTGITVATRTDLGAWLNGQDQIDSWPLDKFVWSFHTLIFKTRPDLVVLESYHVYAWRLNEHTYSEVPTIQIIGALKALCILNAIPYVEQNAQTGKAFFTDDRLKRMNMYFEGAKHARDSLRHAAQFLTFGREAIQEKEKGNVTQQPP
jgi:hypothetical protein